MNGKLFGLFDHSMIMGITIVLLLVGVLLQVIIGVVYQRMIQESDTLSGVESRLLNQCKERFVNCYKLNGGVSNVSVFVDKFINRLRFCGMSTEFIKHLSGQLILAGVFMAGFGVCKDIVEGKGLINILPFYIVSLFGIYIYLSIASIVDIPVKKKMLKTNLMDYLENTIAQRLEHGLLEKERLKWEMDSERNIIEKVDKPYNKREVNNSAFSKEEALELEQLLRNTMIRANSK